MDDIHGFFGEYRWLSNFYGGGFTVDGLFYPSAEHYYQAGKAECELDREYVRESTTPGVAKHRGKRIPLREDWERAKIKVMFTAVSAKFDQNPDLKEKLLETGTAYLEETNTWGDTFWGKCQGKGQNHLGELLMELRDTYRMEQFHG